MPSGRAGATERTGSIRSSPAPEETRRAGTKVGVISPFSATFSLPLNIAEDDARAMGKTPAADSDLRVFFGFVGWTILYCTVLILAMTQLFQVRWRVAD